MIHKYNLVSYPRSGSGFIIQTLFNLGYYFNNDYSSNDYDPNNSILKTHDINGELEIHDESKYLVLLRRDYILNIDAYIRYRPHDITPHPCLIYYNDFYNKWVNNYKNKDNILIVFVEDLNEDMYFKIARFFDLSDIEVNIFVNTCLKELFFKVKITKDDYKSLLNITKNIINDEKLVLEYEIFDLPDYNYKEK
jgi:hypothetical protein